MCYFLAGKARKRREKPFSVLRQKKISSRKMAIESDVFEDGKPHFFNQGKIALEKEY